TGVPQHGNLREPPIATKGSNGGDLSRWGRAPGPFSFGPRGSSASASGRTSMIPRFTARRSLWLAGTIAGLLLTAPAFAQTPPASAPAAAPAAAPAKPALPPGSPLIGRPEGSEAAAKLAPVAAPPLPAPADKLPTALLKLPPGFHLEVYASGVANARSLRIG